MDFAYDVMIYRFVKNLIAEGDTVEEAREKLHREVDESCDEIAYGDEE